MPRQAAGLAGDFGGSFFCAIGVEQQQKLSGIERFAFGTEDAADEGVDGVLELRDLSGLCGDNIEPLLAFRVFYLSTT